MAALNCVESLIHKCEEQNTGQDPVLVAYFFCDAIAEFSTAEDILKSIIRQLITQQESLAPYAKVFAKKKSKDDGKYQSQQASITIENLWQSLQDMLADEFIGSRVYFVLNNLHILPPESDSTIKLMKFISAELEGLHKAKSSDAKRVLTRWLITSREAHNVDVVLKVDGVRVIDLEDAKYENCVQSELRNHAKKMISELGMEKKYNKALTYFASSLIGKRAQNTQWIDITCVQLGELADTESHLRVRRVLETMPQDLKDLLNQSWLQIFRSVEANTVEKIKEMLRAMVLTFEDPTESELGILAGLASNEEEKDELRKLIDHCKPLLALKRTSKNDFISEEDYSEFSESEDEYEDEGEEDEKDPEADILKDKALPYTVKHWLHHASKATLEIAEDLSLEEDFWRPGSIIRHRWMVEYSRMTTTLDGFDYKTMTGLHIAAALGFRQLVAALIRNGHENELQERDSLVNSPLHFAAYLGRPNIVEELLNRGAVIDDAIEIHEQTPLCMASFSGHVNVMKKLLLRGADPNAQADEIGPVINAAISSGNRAAVELLVEHDVSFSLPPGTDETILSPLAMAAELADFSMFDYLVGRYADRIPVENYSQALVRAASAGRFEVFHRLLEFDHDRQTFQSALDAAVEEWNWDVVKTLLEKRRDLDCNGMFLEAATCSVPSDKVVEMAWRYAADNVPITAETLNNSLYHATDREKGSTVKLLLQEFKADPNATGEDYGNALTAAAFDGNLELVQLLIEAGADVNHADGWALQTAATEGYDKIVEELLSHGADVNACTSNANFKQGTALQGACESGKANIVELLLGHDANPNLGTGPDAPPVVAAAMRGEDGIVSHLVQAKADLDVFGGSDHSTPLINAAAYLPQASLKLILDAGADINLPNDEGESALIVAARRGEVEAVTFLIDNGADLMHSSKQGMNALQSAFHSQQYECMGVLVDRISMVLEAIKGAADAGS
ncbi:Ankyrin-3 [Escovopsis weberi]|uniref:Ankyrin-3 n=1 Tax=Escovopsis weberi TaxID=150374 RepID=A0A0M9VXG2_ESCWE|nr:Ankyrin-3 [Escovopsis weberi]